MTIGKFLLQLIQINKKGKDMALVEVSDNTFEAEVLNAEGIVLVDFWAEWCGPCKMLMPIVEEISEELGDQIKIVKVNIDENPATPSQYGVRSIPTLALFKDGQAVSTKVGANPKGKIIEWIDENK